MTAHARLAPSAAHRWINCPGSVQLCAGIEETPSSFAAEGTAAHILAQCCLDGGHPASRFRGWAVDITQWGLNAIGSWTPDGKTIFAIDAEMVDGVQTYLEVIHQLVGESEAFDIEERLDISAFVPGVFGTGDAIAYRSFPTRRVTIVDLKYGKGVAVEVKDNEQLLTYALGVAHRFHNRGIDEVELVIVQPRAPHRDGPVRRWVTDVVGLYEHAMTLQEAAEAVKQANDRFHQASIIPWWRIHLKTGDHCKFCKAAGICPALRDRVLKIVARGDPTMIPFEDWKKEVAELALLTNWAKRREEYAHSEAINGRMPPGAKLVAKRAYRQWKDEESAAQRLELLGVDEGDLYETKMRSPAQVEKALPKSQRDVIGDLAAAVSSGTVLAPIDDPRTGVGPNDARGFEATVIAERD